MRYNWNNLAFDLRDKQPAESASPDHQPQEELEELTQYIVQGQGEIEDNEPGAEETESIEAVKQVNFQLNPISESQRRGNFVEVFDSSIYIILYFQIKERDELRQEVEALKEQMAAMMLSQQGQD